MKNGRLQCKDIDERPILRKLYQSSGWQLILSRKFPDDLLHSFPPGIERHLAIAKMSTLIRRGLVDGCDCGCRGDFELTAKGKEYCEQHHIGVIIDVGVGCLCSEGHYP